MCNLGALSGSHTHTHSLASLLSLSHTHILIYLSQGASTPVFKIADAFIHRVINLAVAKTLEAAETSSSTVSPNIQNSANMFVSMIVNSAAKNASAAMQNLTRKRNPPHSPDSGPDRNVNVKFNFYFIYAFSFNPHIIICSMTIDVTWLKWKRTFR